MQWFVMGTPVPRKGQAAETLPSLQVAYVLCEEDKGWC